MILRGRKIRLYLRKTPKTAFSRIACERFRRENWCSVFYSVSFDIAGTDRSNEHASDNRGFRHLVNRRSGRFLRWRAHCSCFVENRCLPS